MIRNPQVRADRLARILAIFCVALVLCTATIEVVHLCPNQGLSGTPCPLCITAQTTLVALAAVVLPLLVKVASVAAPHAIEAPSVYGGFDLFIRPPPSA